VGKIGARLDKHIHFILPHVTFLYGGRLKDKKCKMNPYIQDGLKENMSGNILEIVKNFSHCISIIRFKPYVCTGTVFSALIFP
jgi:hypothetical protein